MSTTEDELKSHLTRKKMFLMSQDTPETDVQPLVPQSLEEVTVDTTVAEQIAGSEVAAAPLPTAEVPTIPAAPFQVEQLQVAEIDHAAPVSELPFEAAPAVVVVPTAAGAISIRKKLEMRKSEQESSSLSTEGGVAQSEPTLADWRASLLEHAKSWFEEEPEQFVADQPSFVSELPLVEPVQDMKPGQDTRTFKAAMTTVRNYSAMSAASGLIPVPFLDMAGLMAVQLMMLKKLSKIYAIPFNSQRSRSAVAILASGINCRYMAASSSKLIPFVGAFSLAAMPVVNGALSYAVGRVFMKHFASGGTFLDFDPAKLRGYFEEQYHGWKSGLKRREA